MNQLLQELTFHAYETHQKEHQSWHLIIFFRGAWCPVCVQDLKDLEENKSYFESKNVHLITISTDELDNLKKMADEYNHLEIIVI